MFIPAFTTNAMTSGFLSSISPGLGVMSGHLVPSPIVGIACAPIVETRFLEIAMSLFDFSPRLPLGTFYILLPRLPSYGVYISQLVRFAKFCTSVSDFNCKNLQRTSKFLTQSNRYKKLRKAFGKFFRSYSDLLSIFDEISFQEYVTEGISHPVFGDLVYKLRRVRCEADFCSPGSKIVKRLQRRNYDPLIIERPMGLVLGPSTALYRSFLGHCTLTNKAMGTVWRDLSKPPQRRQGPDPRRRLIFSRDSFSPWT